MTAIARAALFIAWPLIAVTMLFFVVLILVVAWPLTLTGRINSRSTLADVIDHGASGEAKP